MEESVITVKKLTIGIYGTNSYLVSCVQTGHVMLIDAPGSFKEFEPHIKGLNIKLIVLTHTHLDHIQALEDLRDRLKVPLAMNSAEADQVQPPPDMIVQDGDTLSVGKLDFRVIHTPGHTSGGICLLNAKHLFSGDTLFPGGPGKTLKPAQFHQIVDSITKKLFPLPNDILVYPGHGLDTVLGKEKEEFAVFSSRQHPDDLCGDVLWLTS
ncbi:MBL fold metallo-hydrolase [Chloroflexota bacterium]